MTIASQLNAICDLLRTQTKLPVVPDRPNEKFIRLPVVQP